MSAVSCGGKGDDAYVQGPWLPPPSKPACPVRPSASPLPGPTPAVAGGRPASVECKVLEVDGKLPGLVLKSLRPAGCHTPSGDINEAKNFKCVWG